LAKKALLLKIAKNFLKEGMSPEKVAEAAELPLEKVRALARKRKSRCST
jgi:hypothetical protein